MQTQTEKIHPLTRYRTTHQLTQDDLSDLIGISQVMISLVENGKRAFNSKTAKKISERLELAVCWQDLVAQKFRVGGMGHNPNAAG